MAGSLNVKILLLIIENQIPQVKEFNAFLYVGWCRSLGSLKSFSWYAPQVSGASPCLVTSWDSSRLTIGSGFSLMAATWQVFFLSWVSFGFTSSCWRAANTDDILCLLIWQEIFHFSVSYMAIWSIWKIEETLPTLLEGIETGRDGKNNFAFFLILFYISFFLIMYMVCLYNERLI